MDKELEKLLLKTVTHNSRMIEHICQQIADQTPFVYDSVGKCECCARAATVQHTNHHEHKICDRCCAEVITRAKFPMLFSSDEALDQLAKITIDDLSWVDMSYTKSVRRVLLFLEQFEATELPTIQ